MAPNVLSNLWFHSQHGAQLRGHPRPEHFFNFKFFLQRKVSISNFCHVSQHGAQTWLGSNPTPAIIFFPKSAKVTPLSNFNFQFFSHVLQHKAQLVSTNLAKFFTLIFTQKHFDFFSFKFELFSFNSFFSEHPKFYTYIFFPPLHTLKIFLRTLRFFFSQNT